MIQVVIDSIRVSLMSPHRVILLREMDSERQLPIWIGPSETDAIVVELGYHFYIVIIFTS